MRFELKHRLDGTIIPFDITNGKITSNETLPVSPQDIVMQYRRGLIHGCTKMYVDKVWEFKICKK